MHGRFWKRLPRRNGACSCSDTRPRGQDGGGRAQGRRRPPKNVGQDFPGRPQGVARHENPGGISMRNIVFLLFSAVLTFLAATVVATIPAGATVGFTEFPYNADRRTCNSYYDGRVNFRLDVCVEIGFSGTNHVGQVVLACRTGSGQAAECPLMTVNNAQLRGCGSTTGPCDTILRQWSDSVARVHRYVSFTPSPSFDCLHSPYWGTKVVATVSVVYPNGTERNSIPLVGAEESQYCF